MDIPLVEGMKELKIGEGSVQDFGKWGRRVSFLVVAIPLEGEFGE